MVKSTWLGLALKVTEVAQSWSLPLESTKREGKSGFILQKTENLGGASSRLFILWVRKTDEVLHRIEQHMCGEKQRQKRGIKTSETLIQTDLPMPPVIL